MRRVVMVMVPVLVALGGVAVLGVHLVHRVEHRWAWRQADLDRNRLSLGQFRGADTGAELAGWVQHGRVVRAGGVARRTSSQQAELVVAYTTTTGGWGGSAGKRVTVCYRFQVGGRDVVDFDEVDCPA